MPKKTKKSKKITRSQLVKKADKLFSIFIRIHYADKSGYVKCFTCGKKLRWDDPQMNCGHFISRKCIPLRWDLNNARPQCFMPCNSKLAGNGEPVLFRRHLSEEVGEEEVKRLEDIYIGWKQGTDAVSTPGLMDIIDDLEKAIIEESKRVR